MSEINVNINSRRPGEFEQWLKGIQKTEEFENTRHETEIDNRLNGKKVLLNPYLENLLVSMFYKIQEPWFRLYSARKSFFPHTYVLHKLLQLIGEESRYTLGFLSTEKLKNWDIYWADICHELNWKFIPSC